MRRVFARRNAPTKILVAFSNKKFRPGACRPRPAPPPPGPSLAPCGLSDWPQERAEKEFMFEKPRKRVSFLTTRIFRILSRNIGKRFSNIFSFIVLVKFNFLNGFYIKPIRAFFFTALIFLDFNIAINAIFFKNGIQVKKVQTDPDQIPKHLS